MRILAVGDVIGRPGRLAFHSCTPKLKAEKNIDMVIVNGENAAHGKGLTPETYQKLLSGGADIVTSGNHIWDNKSVMQILDREPYLLRPANYPEGVIGHGYCIYPHKSKNVGIINISGRTFMQALDCPFTKAKEIIKQIKNECDMILIDFHAEATSEKIAMGYYLDGEVSAIWGTHTHVQTADETILPKGTAYITDLGMVGPKYSVLGIQVDVIIEKFLTGLPNKFEVAERPCIYCGIILDIDDKTNKVKNIERIFNVVE